MAAIEVKDNCTKSNKVKVFVVYHGPESFLERGLIGMEVNKRCKLRCVNGCSTASIERPYQYFREHHDHFRKGKYGEDGCSKQEKYCEINEKRKIKDV